MALEIGAGSAPDAVGTSAARRTTIGARLILGGLAAVLIAITGWFSRWQNGQFRPLLDFDAFYLVAQRVWSGDVERTYKFDQFRQLQIDAIGGHINFLGHWNYPPQFDLLIAPLALLPIGAAYFVFVAGTLGLYLVTLRAISKEYLATIVILLSPALLLALVGGQNGFLTGSLIGLACLAMERNQFAAGASIGLMVIKPHLAAAVGIYTLLAGRCIATTAAIAVVLVSSILCTLLFGVQIWSAFLSSAQDFSAYYARGGFDLYRSISFYAILRGAGFSASFSFLGQIAVASTALSVVAFAIYRKLPASMSLGLAAVASLMISPYAYDYDLPILGVGLALLLPDLTQLAKRAERLAIYGLTFAAGSYGLLQVLRLSIQPEKRTIDQPALTGAVLATLLLLLLRVCLRARTETDQCKIQR